MTRLRGVALVVFVGAVALGTVRDPAPVLSGSAGLMLEADLHVHPFPGDGSLPVWELQREAGRRGLDVIAVTGHNSRAGLAIGRLVPLDPAGPIVLPGQEVTAPGFHLIAVGITRLIDWRLSARAAIADAHAQGGVAIAAHPLGSWGGDDLEALRSLDGIEVAHPIARGPRWVGVRLGEFFNRVRAVNPDVAPIGSTDFHMTAPLGLCRTYLLVGERSAAGALDAIRRGRTVARDSNGRLFGAPEHVAAVERSLAFASPRAVVPGDERLIALSLGGPPR